MTSQKLAPLLIALALAGSVAGCAGLSDNTPSDNQSSDNQPSDNAEADNDDDNPQPSAAAEALAALEAGDFNGVIAVSFGGDVDIQPVGTADPDGDVAIDPETVFDIGSITKQFTATAVVRLQSQGLLSVDDRVGDHLTQLDGPSAETTLHQLLTHTAGLTAAVGDDYDPIDRDAFIDLVSTTELESEPGERYSYSNVGYSLLALVIEQVTGGTYEDFLRAELFEPAGMVDTGYVRPDWSDNTIAVGFLDDDVFGRPNEQVWRDEGPGWHLLGNGGILSTADDMLRWDEALSNDDIVSADERELLFTSHVAEGGDSFYGYGWSLIPLEGDRTLATHNGGNGVFFADFLRLPDEELTIFLATNSAATGVDNVARQLADQLLGTGDIGSDCPAPPIDQLDDGVALDDLPATAAGSAAQRVFTALAGEPGSLSGERLESFAADFIRPHLEPTATLAEIGDGIENLQAEVAAYELQHYVILDDPRAFAAVYDTGDGPLAVGLVLSSGDNPHLLCLTVDG